MNILQTLSNRERRRVANWFKDNTATKLFVIFGFLAVVFGIVFTEYRIGSIYLRFANEYAPFGPAMAVYSLKVAVFLLFVLAVISSTAISNSTLYQNRTLSHLFTLPIKPVSIFISKVVPGWLTSTGVLLLLIPLFFIYNKYIFKSDYFVIVIGFGLLILSIVSQALGTIFSTGIAYFLGKITRQKQLIIIFSLVFCFGILLKLLFPSGMFRLAETDSYSTFQSQIDKFPLMGKLLPTNWLVDSLTGSLSLISTLSAVLVMFCLLAIVKIIGSKYYLLAWRQAQNQSYLAGNNLEKGQSDFDFPKIGKVKNIYSPLVINDILSLVRSNTEVNYSLFLGSMLIILIFSVNSLVILKDTTPGLLLAINLIAFVSVSLIFLISAMRSIFPMMAKEKFTAWFSFSLPLSREDLLKEKLLVSVLLGIPSLPVVMIIVHGLRLSSDKALVLTLLMTAIVMFINILQCLFGSISPNFKEAENPDAVSTSSLGILALMLSLLVIAISTIQLSNYFHSNISGLGFAIRWISMVIVITTPILLIATKSVQKYSL
ncbi:MAG: hypothetical protein WC503_03310 [Candidatus Shapirobacteria bacterium]